MADPRERDPAEGSHQMIEPRATSGESTKNPEQEAEKPGGTPTDTVKGSAPSRDPEGQQGTTVPRGN